MILMDRCPYHNKGDGFKCEYYSEDRICDKIPYSDFTHRLIAYEEGEGVGGEEEDLNG